MRRGLEAGRRSTALGSIALVFVAAGAGFAWDSDVGADQPVVRFAAPLATGQGPCDATSPCGLVQAVAAAQNGDEIVVEPGRYGLAHTLTIDKDVTLHGSAGPLPSSQIRYAGDGPAIEITAHSAIVSDLAIEALGQTSEALAIGDGLAERIRAEALAPQVAGLIVNGGVVRDSLAIATGQGAAALESVAAGPSQQLSATVDHVTAIASGPQSIGVLAQADAGGNVQLSVTNTIAAGAGDDLAEQGNTLKGSTASIATSHDDFASHADNNGGKLSDDGTSIVAAPQFISAAADDYREAEKAPTIDAGALGSDKSELDLDGGPRAVGEPDIGAFEAGGPPALQLQFAAGGGLTGEDVSGVVIPNGSPTTYYVEFGPTTAYGSQTQPQDGGSGGAAETAHAALSGLSPDTTYHYRFVASSPAGTSHSADGIFRTGSAHIPLAYTGGAPTSARGTAKLTGSANPGGLASTASFQWGTTAKYGSATPAMPIGAGDADVPVSAAVTGLRPGVSYHYRLVAQNADGTNDGLDEVFTTPAAGMPTVRTRHAKLHNNSVTVTLACPRSAGADCDGRLVLERAQRAIASTNYDLRPGASRSLTVRLARRARHALIRAGREAVLVVVTPAGQHAGHPQKLILTA